MAKPVLYNTSSGTREIRTLRADDNALGSGVVLSGAIASGQIGTNHIGNNAVTSGNIASGAIGPFHIASGAVSSGEIANQAIASGSIASGQIGSIHIGSGQILSGNIASGQIGFNHLASGIIQSGSTGIVSGSTVDTSQQVLPYKSGSPFVINTAELISGIRAVSISSSGTAQIAMASIESRMPAIGVITENISSGLAANIITIGHIDNFSGSINLSGQIGRQLYVGRSGQITTSDLGYNSGGYLSGDLVQILGIIDGTDSIFVNVSPQDITAQDILLSGDIGSGQIGSFHLSSGSVVSGRIASGQIGTNHIGNNAVASGNIASGQIGLFHIASGAVRSGNIASGQIGPSHLSSGSILSGSIASGQIGLFHLASGTILSGVASGSTIDTSLQVVPFISGSPFTIATSELISGVRAVSLNASGEVQIAMASIPNRMPAIGVVRENTNSGSPANVLAIGHISTPASGIINYSGEIGRQIFVGRSGQLHTAIIAGFTSGDILQTIGVAKAADSAYITVNPTETYSQDLIFSGDIASGQVGAFHLASGSVVSGRIASGQIGSFHLGSGSILSGTIASGQIGRNHLGNNSVGSGTIASGQIGIFHLASGAVRSGNIGSGQIGPSHLSSGSILSGSIASGQVGNFHIASGSVSSGRLSNQAVASGTIATGQVGAIHIGSGQILSGAIASGQIGVNHLSSGSVSSGAIASGAIGSFHIASGAVSSGVIANQAVASGSIASGQIGAIHIGSGQILSGSIASGQIGLFHLASGTILSGVASGSTIDVSQQVLPYKSGSPFIINTAELISGIRAVNITSSATLQIAMASIPNRMPAVGIVSDNIASGQAANVIAIGHIDNPASGLVNQSGQIGRLLYVGRSGQIAPSDSGYNSGGFVSGDLLQTVGIIDGLQSIYVNINPIEVFAEELILSGDIGSGQIGSFHIADNSIVSGRIASGQIGNGHLASGAVLSGNIASGQIGTNHIGNNAVTSGNIASGQIGLFHIASGAVRSGNIASGQIGPSHLASGSVLSGAIASGQVGTNHIGNNAVTSGNIASGAIGSFHIASGAVSSGVIANQAVASGSIASGQIGSIHIGSGQILSGNISSGQIGPSHLSSGSVLSGSIASGQIGARHISSGVLGVSQQVIPYRSGDVFTINTAEMISGVKAVSISPSGTLRIAMASDVLRMPAVGIVNENVNSGQPATVITIGHVDNVISGVLNYSGQIGKQIWVGRSGDITAATTGFNSGGFVSGDILQVLGVVDGVNSLLVNTYPLDTTFPNTIVSGDIGSGQIGSFHLSSGAIVSGRIASGQIGNNHLASGAVQSGHIGNNAVVSGSIASGQIGTNHIGNNAVTSGNIASGQIGLFHIASGAVRSGNIASGQIGPSHLASGSVLSGAIASGQIGPLHIASGGVLSGNIASGQIGLNHLASGAIRSGVIASGQIGTNHIASGGVLSGNIASGQIGSFHIASGGILSGNIASGQIADNHFSSGAVINAAKNCVLHGLVTEETISGLRAINISFSGYARIAQPSISGRMPAIGLNAINALSGQSIVIITHGIDQSTSGMANFSGHIGRELYVGSGGLVATGTNIVSGIVAQRIGQCLNSGGLFVNACCDYSGYITSIGLAPPPPPPPPVPPVPPPPPLPPCWVAREVYGADNARWAEFNYWLMTYSPLWLRKAYIKHGERFAYRMSEKTKARVKALMDSKLLNVNTPQDYIETRMKEYYLAVSFRSNSA